MKAAKKGNLLTLDESTANLPISPVAGLTPRELQICAMAALGDKQIAARLHISIATVRSHFRSIAVKLDVRSRAAALVVLLTSDRGPILIPVG